MLQIEKYATVVGLRSLLMMTPVHGDTLTVIFQKQSDTTKLENNLCVQAEDSMRDRY